MRERERERERDNGAGFLFSRDFVMCKSLSNLLQMPTFVEQDDDDDDDDDDDGAASSTAASCAENCSFCQ